MRRRHISFRRAFYRHKHQIERIEVRKNVGRTPDGGIAIRVVPFDDPWSANFEPIAARPSTRMEEY